MEPAVGQPGIDDIASEVGVSPSLVSKVLSGRLGTTRVSTRTVAAIRNRADRIGYRKNSSATALATGRQNVIGAFVHRHGVLGSGLTEALLDGITAELACHDQRLLLHFFESDRAFIAQCQRLHAGVIDGLIVGGLSHPGVVGTLERIRDSGIPVVTIHDAPVDPGFVNVGADQARVGRIATEHLLERGCRRIAHISIFRDRCAGYRAALEDAGHEPDARLVYEAPNFTYQAGVDAVRTFAERGIEYDGLVAQSDQQAAGALNTLVAMGRRVPRDVRIVGVDDSPLCLFSSVALSSVSQMDRERARLAARLLLEITRGEVRESVSMDPVLQVRASSE